MNKIRSFAYRKSSKSLLRLLAPLSPLLCLILVTLATFPATPFALNIALAFMIFVPAPRGPTAVPLATPRIPNPAAAAAAAAKAA